MIKRDHSRTKSKGEWMRINARDDVGDSGYGVPYNVEEEKIELLEHDVNFIMAIETGGMFDRLIENGFDEDFNCALVHSRSAGSFNAAHFETNERRVGLPVVVFLDGDPWSFRIFASIAYGAIKTAHISEYLAPHRPPTSALRPTTSKRTTYRATTCRRGRRRTEGGTVRPAICQRLVARPDQHDA